MNKNVIQQITNFSSYGLLKEVVALCDLHQWRDYTEARQATAPGVKLHGRCVSMEKIPETDE